MSMNSENRIEENNYVACPQYEAALEDQLQGTLRGPEAVKLAGHLATCAGCRGALEDAAVSARLLAIAEPAPDPGAGFSRIVMARIRQELQTNEGNPFGVRSWRWRGALRLRRLSRWCCWFPLTWDATASGWRISPSWRKTASRRLLRSGHRCRRVATT